jgi:ABC-2 type transport system ATP-binding protein
MIITQGLTKHYGKTTALDNLDLEVRQGEVFGLLGPNGSGKTTALRLILGLLRPSAGRATVAGHDCWNQSLAVRNIVAYLPGELRMFGAFTGFKTLKFFADLRDGVGLDRAVAIAEEIMELDLDKKVRHYSTGMKQKLALSQVFSDPVDVLLLDEATSALDPTARSQVLDLVAGARRAGQTVVFSGHVLSEVEEVADRVGIMRKGRLMHVQDMRPEGVLRLVQVKFDGDVPGELPEGLGLTLRKQTGSTLLLEHRSDIGPLLGWLNSQPVADLAIGTPDLRALYDQYHGPRADDGGNST